MADLKIMVVDDNKAMLRLAEMVLKKLGFNNVVLISSALDALERLNEESFDVIFSDWIMPEMSGLEFLKEFRKIDKFKHTPFIMLTAKGDEKHVRDAIQVGVTNYIVKPFTAKILSKKIKKVMESKMVRS